MPAGTSFRDSKAYCGKKPWNKPLRCEVFSVEPNTEEKDMSDDLLQQSRRNALKCLAYGGVGTLFAFSGGVLTPTDLAAAAAARADKDRASRPGRPLLVQLSDTHIGFNKDANPDVNATLAQTIDLVNEMDEQPALIIHTGDITHLSRPGEFDLAQQMFSRLRTTELHTVPGEHDTTDPTVTEYFNRFGRASDNRGYYSFDHSGVHFLALINVLKFKPGGLGTLGEEQLAWAKADLKGRSASTPIVVFAHMPLWSIYEPWGWGTGDADQLVTELRRFGSVTVLNGHIHQIVQKVEGHMTFHTARSTAYPQPAAGVGAGPGPLKVPADQLSQMLGVSSVSIVKHPRSLALSDSTLADHPAKV
jgi:Calcineurin-like phosphoesterase